MHSPRKHMDTPRPFFQESSLSRPAWSGLKNSSVVTATSTTVTPQWGKRQVGQKPRLHVVGVSRPCPKSRPDVQEKRFHHDGFTQDSLGRDMDETWDSPATLTCTQQQHATGGSGDAPWREQGTLRSPQNLFGQVQCHDHDRLKGLVWTGSNFRRHPFESPLRNNPDRNGTGTAVTTQTKDTG